MVKPFIDEHYELWWLLIYTRLIIYRARRKELLKHGITSEESAALWAIKSIGSEAKPAAIARWLMRKPHSISGLISRMEKRGLINKTYDLERKNWVRINLTEKGEKAYVASLSRESIHKIFSNLSEEELKQFKSCLSKLCKGGFEELNIKSEEHFKDLFPVDIDE